MTYIHSPYSVDQTHKTGRFCTPRVYAVLQGTTTAPDPCKPLREMKSVAHPPPIQHTQAKLLCFNQQVIADLFWVLSAILRYVKVQDVSHQLVSGCSPTFGWYRLIGFHDLNRPQSAFCNPAGQTKNKRKPSLENMTNNDKIKSSALIKRGVYSPGHASCINKATTCRIPAHPVLVTLRVCSKIIVLQHTQINVVTLYSPFTSITVY